MRTAIMQPYFFPYIGYYQLMASVDLFVVYDNIKYTKKGWINRNRVLLNGGDATISLPLKNAPDSLDIRERLLAEDFNAQKLTNQISGAYRRAPYFGEAFPFIEHIVEQTQTNLFSFLYNSIHLMARHLRITTPCVISSDVSIDHSLRSQDKVIAICRAVETEIYVNSSGGKDLYSRSDFLANGIDLRFIQSKPLIYPQFGWSFVPNLSIIDVLMFNSLDVVVDWVNSNYELT